MNRTIRLILIILLVIFVIIQFIRPAKNISPGLNNYDISNRYSMSPEVQKIFQNSCYDCHSNNTRYPWYWQVQPVTWWMNGHISDAKREVNYSQFLSYPARKQFKKIEATDEEVQKGDMPLPSYTIIHRTAKLNDEQKKLVKAWADSVLNQLKSSYPPDSLLKK
ncbi:MAG: heme-binding domain-containing protein [Ginsengibacter sp.]